MAGKLLFPSSFVESEQNAREHAQQDDSELVCIEILGRGTSSEDLSSFHAETLGLSDRS